MSFTYLCFSQLRSVAFIRCVDDLYVQSYKGAGVYNYNTGRQNFYWNVLHSFSPHIVHVANNAPECSCCQLCPIKTVAFGISIDFKNHAYSADNAEQSVFSARHHQESLIWKQSCTLNFFFFDTLLLLSHVPVQLNRASSGGSTYVFVNNLWEKIVLLFFQSYSHCQ